MEFNGCPHPTVGVEWELQLIDQESLDLFDGILPLMAFFPDTQFVKPEYIQSCVELTSCIASDSDEAVAHIRGSLLKILPRCHGLNMGVVGAGTHPFCKRLALITPTPRYQRIEENAGYLAHTQITFSTHVHVGMRSGEDAIRAMSHLVPALPVFIALSANSPFWRDHETGHAAYRHRILAAAPNFGMPVTFRDWRDFERFYNAAVNSGMIRRFKDIHWDIRPHPDFGTLEIRAMDAATSLQTLHSLVAFTRVLVVSMADSGREEVARVVPLELSPWIYKENCYRASHYGLEAQIIFNRRGDCRPLRGLIGDLLDFCRPVAVALGEDRHLDRLPGLLLAEPGYSRQLETWARRHSTRAVVKDLQDLIMEVERLCA